MSYLTAFGRIYRLALSDACSFGCHFCSQVGGVSSQNTRRHILDKHFVKAVTGHYQSILITCAKVEPAVLRECIEQVLKNKLTCILQVRFSEFYNLSFEFKTWLQHKNVSVCILVTSQDQVSPDALNEIRKLSSYFYMYLPLLGQVESQLLLNVRESEKEKVYFNLPLKTKLHDVYMGPKQVKAYIEQMAERFPLIKVRTLPGLDLYEPRVPPLLELEPILKPRLKKIKNKKAPQVSIIIPTYNSCESLKYVLQGLFKQTLRPTDYEIIIVDDGSTDKTKQMVFDFFRKNKADMNFKYFYLPRPQARERGDHQYRAGIARNLGVKNSCGRYLLFIDSDILLPEQFLEQLPPLLGQYDLIQAKRLNFRPRANQVSAESFEKLEGTYEPDEGFLSALDQMPWQEVQNKWKYVCTYCLCMKREHFYKLGWFRKSFCSYGFEDSELGYRFYKADAKFYYIKTPVLHFEPSVGRSEYKNSMLKKRRLLGHSAQTFYFLHPDEEVYQTLDWLWGDLRFAKESFYARLVKSFKKAQSKVDHI